jgi:hypothetical protein
MSKTKKRNAIICVVLNLILLSQVCFGTVSGLYDAVIGGESGEDQHICDDHDHELQAESVCTEEEMHNMRCCPHFWDDGSIIGPLTCNKHKPGVNFYGMIYKCILTPGCNGKKLDPTCGCPPVIAG